MATRPEPSVLEVATAAQWERWLDRHHADTPEGVWLRLYRKDSKPPGHTLTYADAVLAALCFGWIDGQGKRLDDASRVQRFTPRRARSVWSKLNVERAAKLIDEGRMRPAGLAAIEAARADGRWEQAYDAPSTAAVPDDFLAELAKRPKAQAFYETLTKRNTYPIVHRLQTARTDATRRRRIAAIVDMFERGEKFHD
jgi:uncharacterized protein YdeI (YjbR/CyaY-like superfamily)